MLFLNNLAEIDLKIRFEINLHGFIYLLLKSALLYLQWLRSESTTKIASKLHKMVIRHMNKLSYGPKKKYALAGKTLINVKKHGKFNGATPRALRGLLFVCPQKTSKNGHFWAFWGWPTHFLKE